MPASRVVALRFSGKTAFGEFCLALSEDDVPFHLAGFRTVVLVEGPPASARAAAPTRERGRGEPRGAGEEAAPASSREGNGGVRPPSKRMMCLTETCAIA